MNEQLGESDAAYRAYLDESAENWIIYGNRYIYRVKPLFVTKSDELGDFKEMEAVTYEDFEFFTEYAPVEKDIEGFKVKYRIYGVGQSELHREVIMFKDGIRYSFSFNNFYEYNANLVKSEEAYFSLKALMGAIWTAEPQNTEKAIAEVCRNLVKNQI